MRNKYKNYYKRVFESLTFQQICFIEDNLTTMKRADIAQAIGISVAKLRRAANHIGWHFSFSKGIAERKYDLSTIQEVLNFYDKNGKKKTKEQFPNLNTRSIVEGYGKGRNPRCRKWKNKELIELLKMAGIILREDQAKYFGRPGANKGSIISVWSKRIGCRPIHVNGLPEYKAKYYVKSNCPYIRSHMKHNAKIFLWVEMLEHLRDDCPDFIKEAITAMSKFQLKLFKNPRSEIEKIIRERSSRSNEIN